MLDFSFPAVRLGEGCRLITDGSHFSPTPQVEGHPIVNAKDIPNGRIDLSTCTRISQADWIQLRAQSCAPQEGDVLLSKDGTIGRVVHYRENQGVVLLSSVAILRPNSSLDSEFLAQVLRSHLFDAQLFRLQSGSALKRLVLADIRKIEVPRPSPGVQQRIAEILSTVDEAIEQTQALIAKTQQIKAGLMHDLFTRGVTADGQLRPPREEAPQLYEESPLGWIPKEWGTAILNDLVSPARPVVYGILMPGRGHPGGIPVIKVKDINDGEILGDDLLLTSPQIDAEYQRSKVRPRDVLLTIRGTVGRLAQVPRHLDGANITQDTARIGIAAGCPEFYRYYLETHAPRRHFAVNTLGQAVQGINLRDVRTTPVPIAPDDEQVKIAEMVIAAVCSERTEREYLAKLVQAKRGLMQDLLSGRGSVTASAERTVTEVAVSV